jgi:beta-galactosidase/sacsin
VLNQSGPGPYSGWPTVFGAFGNVDIAGFAKPSAWWYRTNWLAKTPIRMPERPLVGGGSNGTVRALTPCEGFASTPWAEMVVDGVRKGITSPAAQSGIVRVGGCDPEASGHRNVTLLGLDSDRTAVLGRHTVLAPGATARVELVLDVPSPSTGTGSALFLDGLDVALIRVQLVDEEGVVVTDDDRNVSFRVASGPIRIGGVGSGDNTNRQHVQGARYQTFRGLGRAVLQTTVDCTSPGRMLAREIDLDKTLTFADECPTDSAVLIAEVDGLRPVRIAIPISGAMKHHPMAVARSFRSLDTFSFLDDVQA